MKKVLAILMAFILILTSVLVFRTRGSDIVFMPEVFAASREFEPTRTNTTQQNITHMSIDEALSNQQAREGFILAPTIISLSGVDPLSNFILRSPAFFEDNPIINISGQPEPTITRENSNTFIITPAVPLSYNSVYVFTLENENITWAFQTMTIFQIMSTLPRHQSTNVPVRTGIEINFSLGSPDISNHFSISPQVEGGFTLRGNTAIFVPAEPLEFAQVYTITINAGVSLVSGETLENDYTFQFETAAITNNTINRERSSVFFHNSILDFPSFEAPEVRFTFTGEAKSINMNVYRIENRDDAISSIRKLAQIPSWSSFNSRLIDVSRLRNVYTSKYEPSKNWLQNFKFSRNLAPGFYILEASTNDTKSQMIIQITDLSVQVVADDNMALLWINDMNTGNPAQGAVVYEENGRSFNTSEAGIAIIEEPFNDMFIVTANGGMENIVFSPHHGRIQNQQNRDKYWAVLQLDRTLFQRNDTINIWGFVQNRHENEQINHVTAVITERTWWWGWSNNSNDTLVRQNIPVKDGIYSSEIVLPYLNPNTYELIIYHGEIVLGSVFFSVQDYVTPPYELTVSTDKTAIFINEKVNFTIRSAFFEGTPVPLLPISYDFWGDGLRSPSRGESETNTEGIFEISAIPAAVNATVQGERNLSFEVNATLPEIGWVSRSSNIRVFINDIDINARAIRRDNQANLNIDVNSITLDRINNGTAEHWSDFLDKPIENQILDVKIIELTWEAVPTGTRYDHILRQTVETFRHEQRTREIHSFELVTDSTGNANIEFNLPDTERASFRAEITTKDTNGRIINQTAFIGRDFSWFFQNAGQNDFFLDGVKEEGYDIGDEVNLTVMRGLEPATGAVLFVTVQNGIINYQVGEGNINFIFGERHVPNIQVFAFHFNGHIYSSNWNMSQILFFNAKSKNLNLEITTDKETYKPSEVSSITIRATDLQGNPRVANINISLVDYALFALMDYNVDTLEMLYRYISNHLRLNFSSHRTFESDGRESLEEEADYTYAAAAPEMAANDMGGGDTHIRERFEDTAVFLSGRTNEQGLITFNFILPDNITSWRVTASAICNDLYAGNSIGAVRVSMPMFLNYSLNRTFLIGDKPYIGVNAFGDALLAGDTVLFEVHQGDNIIMGEGRAFERVNIPLGEMTTEGVDSLVIYAHANNYSDAIRHEYNVIKTHRQADIARFYEEVDIDTIFETNPQGLTDITFLDRGRGRFLSHLIGMRYIWRTGQRLEGLLARREADKLISKHFRDISRFSEPVDLNILDYQVENGGISILPYSDADLATTILVLPFIKDEINTASLRRFLWGAYERDNKFMAMYGLALIGEPVLVSLREAALIDNLSIRDTAYIALGLLSLGERQAAHDLFKTNIEPQIIRLGEYYRVDNDQILDSTSITALLAAMLGEPYAIGLHEYSQLNRWTGRPGSRTAEQNMILNIERLLFITHEINNHTDERASITYTLFGETITRNLWHGGTFNLRIPAMNMHEFQITDITGDVGAVSIIRVPLEEIEQVEADIAISREYFLADGTAPRTNFNQGDLVRVQVRIDYTRRAMAGSYIITDFLPAGLVYVPHSARMGGTMAHMNMAHVSTEGARITFFDFHNMFNNVRTYYY